MRSIGAHLGGIKGALKINNGKAVAMHAGAVNGLAKVLFGFFPKGSGPEAGVVVPDRDGVLCGRAGPAAWLVVALVLTAPVVPVAAEDAAARRGEYIFRAGGCVGCHTDFKNKKPALAGGRAIKTPFGIFCGPNITPDRKTGIGEWGEDDIVFLFKTGVTPEGDVVGALVAEVVEHVTKHLRDEDLNAMAIYLRSLPPKRKKIARNSEKSRRSPVPRD